MPKKILLTSLLIFPALIIGTFIVRAASVTFTADTFVKLTGLTTILEVTSGSECDLFDVDANTLTVSGIPASSSLSLKTTAHNPAITISPTGSGADFFLTTSNLSFSGAITQWTLSAPGTTSVSHTIGVSQPSTSYSVKVAGVTLAQPTSTASSLITFSYTGALSNQTFIIEIAEDPVLSDTSDSTTTSTGATITWTTNKNSSTQVEYGLTSSYGRQTTETDTSTRVTSHSTIISGLAPCTVLHYRGKSTDSGSNQGTSSDQTFVTSGCLGNATASDYSSQQITNSGGSMTSASSTLTIPSGLGDLVYQILKLDSTPVIQTTGTPADYSTVGSHVYEYNVMDGISARITSVITPITITLTYSDSDITNLQESSLLIYHWNGTIWESLSNCNVNTSANSVSCQTTSFSPFGLFGTPVVDSPSSSSDSSSSSSSGGHRKHDPDRDGDYDIFDFNILMINWGKTGPGNYADINQDQIVDIFDFNSLMARWTL